MNNYVINLMEKIMKNILKKKKLKNFATLNNAIKLFKWI